MLEFTPEMKELIFKELEKNHELRNKMRGVDGFDELWEDRALVCKNCGESFSSESFGAHYDSIEKTGACEDCLVEYSLKEALKDCARMKVDFSNTEIDACVGKIQASINQALIALDNPSRVHPTQYPEDPLVLITDAYQAIEGVAEWALEFSGDDRDAVEEGDCDPTDTIRSTVDVVMKFIEDNKSSLKKKVYRAEYEDRNPEPINVMEVKNA